MKKRSQIAEKYKWNLEDIYSDEKELLSDINDLKRYPEILASYKGKLKKANKCYEFFQLCTEITQKCEKVDVYISLKLS